MYTIITQSIEQHRTATYDHFRAILCVFIGYLDLRLHECVVKRFEDVIIFSKFYRKTANLPYSL